MILYPFSNKSQQISLSYKNEKPNILFILANDFGFQGIIFFGRPYYETPNIDKLAFESIVFAQGFSGRRVYSPSRATNITGKFTARHGITNWIREKSGED